MSENNGNFDLIVVGAGTAGMTCAIIAAQTQARVLVVEKSAEVGGTLHLTGGHMSAGGTRRQHERGITDSPEQHFQDVMRLSRNTADPVLVRLAVEEAPHTLDWLDQLGFDFAPETPTFVYGHEPYSNPRTAWGVDTGKSILAVLRPLWEEQVAAGRIELRLQHTLTNLLFEEGRISGVQVQKAGQLIELRATATVLATGGYAANPDFFRQVTPGNPKLVSTARPTSTGDGLIVAQRHGAKFHNAEKYLPSNGGIETEPGSGRADFWSAWAVIHSSRTRPPREIYVNVRGERFIAEDVPGPDPRERAIMEQPGHQMWLIFDEAALSEDGPRLVRQWDADQLRAIAAEGRCAWQADNLAELAAKAGIAPAGLIASVAEFNRATQTGDDRLGRTDLRYLIQQPPFYALLTHATSLISFGGLAVNGQLQVMDNQGQPIPGLYAIGEILGAGATNGNAFCGGMLLTPALSFGRILGRRLAAC